MVYRFLSVSPFVRRLLVVPVATSVAAISFAACGGATTATPDDGASGSSSGSSSSSGSASSSGGASSSASSSSGSSGSPDGGVEAGVDPAILATASCSAPVPAGAETAAPLPTYAGTCPTLEPGGTFTTITSSGAARRFFVYKPETIAPGEKLPVVFLWHWLGGDPEDMARVIDAQNVANTRRVLAVIPAPKGDAAFRWPFETTQTQARIDEELRFFDDMLACVNASVPVNKECVASMGVSAGALWTAQLASGRSTRISSFVSLSGGTGGVIKNWTPGVHAMPGLVLWGGAGDVFPEQLPIMNFEKASKNLEGALVAGGHFFVECIHNCGHAVPPFDPPPAGTPAFDIVWRFVLDHPFWLGGGQSPMAGKPLPSPTFPSWCSIGQGTAVPRAANAACD